MGLSTAQRFHIDSLLKLAADRSCRQWNSEAYLAAANRAETELINVILRSFCFKRRIRRSEKSPQFPIYFYACSGWLTVLLVGLLKECGKMNAHGKCRISRPPVGLSGTQRLDELWRYTASKVPSFHT